MAIKYSSEMKLFIAANVKGRRPRELASLVNAEFGLQITESQIKSFKSRYKLRSGLSKAPEPGLPTKLWPAEIRKFIEENHVGVSGMDMAALVNKKFGTSYTPQQSDSYYGNHGINSGLCGRFRKGHIPHNKGVKGLRYSPATEFKKGQLPANTRAVGDERICPDGYTWVKVENPKKWREKHVLLWEEHNDPVPKGHCLLFLNGDKQDIRIENLTIITRAQNIMLNKFNLISEDPEVTKAGILTAELILKISERKKGKKRKGKAT